MDRDRTLQIRVTKEEKKAIERQAHLENFATVSDFLRKLALDKAGYRPKPSKA